MSVLILIVVGTKHIAQIRVLKEFEGLLDCNFNELSLRQPPVGKLVKAISKYENYFDDEGKGKITTVLNDDDDESEGSDEDIDEYGIGLDLVEVDGNELLKQLKGPNSVVDKMIKEMDQLASIDNQKTIRNRLESVNSNHQMNEYEIKAFNIIQNGDDADRFESFIKTDGKLVDVNRNYDGNYLLLEAIKYERYGIVKYLIETMGVALDVVLEVDEDADDGVGVGVNALQMAVFENKGDGIIELLIKHGCGGSKELEVILLNKIDQMVEIDEEKVDAFGVTALYYIIARGKMDMLRHMKNVDGKILMKRDQYANRTCLDLACMNGHHGLVKDIINKYYKDKFPNELLISLVYAALTTCNKPLDILEWLFSRAQLPYDVNHALSFVGGSDPASIINKIEFLRSKGANIQRVDATGNNLLMIFCSSVYLTTIDISVVDYLMTKGIKLNHINQDGNTVLNLVACRGYTKLFLQLKHRMELSGAHYNAYKATIHAIMFGHIDIVKLLLPKVFPNDHKALSDEKESEEELSQRQNLLNLCLEYGRYEIFYLIKNVSDCDTPLLGKIINYDTGNVLLIHSLCLLNASKPESMLSALFSCFQKANLKFLMSEKLEIDNYEDTCGANAFHVASLFGRNDLLIWLYTKKKSYLHSTDSFGFTSLHYALTNGKLSTVVLLQALGLTNSYGYGCRPLLNHYLLSNNYDNKIKLNLQQQIINANIITFNLVSNKVSKDTLTKVKQSVQSLLNKLTLKK